MLSNAGGVLNTLEIVLEDLDDETYNRIDKNMNNVFDAGFALSIACNLYASTLILYKARYGYLGQLLLWHTHGVLQQVHEYRW